MGVSTKSSRKAMMEKFPHVRRDLEFFPVQHEGAQWILVRDHLGLVEEGKAVPVSLYQVMTLLDGTRDMRDLQMALMRQQGGVLVGGEEVMRLLAHLDDSYLLDSERFKKARDEITVRFSTMKVRPCTHSGQAYPGGAHELKARLDHILGSAPTPPPPGGKVLGLVSPHIDLSVGERVYGSAYRLLKGAGPSRVIVLGVGHQMAGHLFSVTEKGFETPLGRVRNDREQGSILREAGGDVVAPDDFAHRSEHSIEFQLIFLQHLLSRSAFTIIPILCGSMQACLQEYTRKAYLERAMPILAGLKRILRDPGQDTLLVAGVDFSHTGPKFGHDMPASYLQAPSQAHDKELLKQLSMRNAEGFWEESVRVMDAFNVCGFSAMACLLEVLPECRGHVLDYEMWHEEATRSAVSFAAVAFTS